MDSERGGRRAFIGVKVCGYRTAKLETIELQYFSEREFGESPRDKTAVSQSVWDGLAWLIQERINNGSFGLGFPDSCPDSPSICCGVDKRGFEVSIKAKIPDLEGESWSRRWEISAIELPPLTVIMDIIEFCWHHVGSPTLGNYHPFFQHYHLGFDKIAGQTEFRNEVNLIFRRNGLAYNLTEDGRIERLLPVEFDTLLRGAVFQTGDFEFDAMLGTARRKILVPDENERREALEKLWDAWERVKTIKHSDKKVGAKEMLDTAATSLSPKFRALLESEATALTNAGDSFQIRHSETNQEHLKSAEHVDYLFFSPNPPKR